MKRLIVKCGVFLTSILFAVNVFASADFEKANSEYLSIGSAICSTQPFSVSLWLNVDDVDNDYTLFFIGDKDVNNEFLISMDSNGSSGSNFFRSRVRSSAEGQDDQQAGSISAGVWEHFGVVVVSTSSRKIYPDGASPSTDTTTVNPQNPDRTTIGVLGRSLIGNYLDGKVAEVAVWCSERTDTDMTNLFNGDNPLTISPQPDAYWRLLDDATDWFGNNNMTENGTITYSSVDHPNVDDPPTGASILPWLRLLR